MLGYTVDNWASERKARLTEIQAMTIMLYNNTQKPGMCHPIITLTPSRIARIPQDFIGLSTLIDKHCSLLRPLHNNNDMIQRSAGKQKW